MLNARHKECFSRIDALGVKEGVRLYVVGGTVRDLLRGLELNKNDIDILVEGDALTFARQVQADIGGTLRLFPEFLTAKLSSPDLFPELKEIDFASARTETYSAPGELPDVSYASIANDLRRRDFSINALALPFSSFLDVDVLISQQEKLKLAIIDQFRGISDLESGLIRVLHSRSFLDDPTRLFRALRYQHRIGGMLEQETAGWFQSALDQGMVSCISFRRQLNELVKILSEEKARSLVDEMVSSRLLQVCFDNLMGDDGSRSVLADRLKSLAVMPPAVRTHGKSSLENALLLILMEVAGEEGRKKLYQQLSISRSTRAILEQDLEMAEESDREHVYSAAGFLYCAMRQPQLSDWALEQLSEIKVVS